MGLLKAFQGTRLRDLAPEVPAIADFSTGLSMGQNGERLAKRLHVTREEQDAYALMSHLRAAKAAKEGYSPIRSRPSWFPRKWRS